MARQHISEYVDRQAVSADTDFLISELEQVYAQFQKVNSVKISIASDTNGTRATADALKRLNDEIAKLSRLNANAAREALNYQKAQTASKKAIQETEKAQQQAIKTERERIKLEQEKQKAERESQRLKAQAEKDALKEKKMTDDLINEYLQLSRAYDEAALKYKNYALILGENDPITRQQLKTAQDMHATLSRLDQNVGNYRRNVGNYGSAFNGLNMQMNQLTRELPALAVGMNTFMLALSNNIPMFTDEIQKAKVEIKALQEAGKPAPSLFKVITGALFSWQTALSIGVTLLTVYGGKLFELAAGMVSVEKNTLKAAEAVKKFSQSARDADQNNREWLDFLKGDLLSPENTAVRVIEDQIKLAEAAGKTREEIAKLRVELAELLQLRASKEFMRTGGFGEIERLKAQVTSDQIDVDLARKLIADEEVYNARNGIEESEVLKSRKLRLEAAEADLEVTKRNYEEQKKIVQAYFETRINAQAAALELEQAMNEEQAAIMEKTFFSEPLKDYVKMLKEVSESEQMFYQARVNYRTEAAEIEKQIVEKQRATDEYNAGIALAELLRRKDTTKVELINAENEKNAAIKSINERANFELEIIERQLVHDLLQIKGNAHDVEKKEQKEFYEELLRMAKAAAEKEKAIFDKRYADLANVQGATRARQLTMAAYGYLNGQGKDVNDGAGGTIQGLAGLRSLREYRQEQARINREYDLAQRTSNLEMLQERRERLKADGESVLEIEKDIWEARRQLAEDGAEEWEHAAQVWADLRSQLISESINVFGAAVNAGFENRINELQEEIRLIEERKRTEIEAINATALSEEEKAARIYNINQKAALQREQLEQRQKQIAERQARFQKAIDVMQIINSTAKSIMAIYADTLLPTTIKPALAAAAGAIGAAQMAVVLATPVPKYKDGIYGKNAHGGGKAILNDGGKREVVVEPGKYPYLQRGVNELVDLSPGTQVYPDLQTFASMNNLAAGDLAVNSRGELEILTKRQNELAVEQNRHLKAIAKAVKNNTGIKHGNRTTSVSGSNKQLTYLNNATS